MWGRRGQRLEEANTLLAATRRTAPKVYTGDADGIPHRTSQQDPGTKQKPSRARARPGARRGPTASASLTRFPRSCTWPRRAKLARQPSQTHAPRPAPRAAAALRHVVARPRSIAIAVGSSPADSPGPARNATPSSAAHVSPTGADGKERTARSLPCAVPASASALASPALLPLVGVYGGTKKIV
jgi:hypothetical protein